MQLYKMSAPITDHINDYASLYGALYQGIGKSGNSFNLTEHLYDTHLHLDLQKDRIGAISECKIEEHQIYTIAVTNLPDLYRKRNLAKIASKYIRFATWFSPRIDSSL